ncbi:MULTISPECIES: hypothetical protein [Bradyrhizobium]|uniref:hypothetical protein n=1 Tax=Bradyrhizobium embrapense TaxID=630921 RepID=UPI00067AF5A4|nr:hypothetical protein [Bradyrhizobium embrapense]
MSQKGPLVIVNVVNPDAFAGKGSIIVLEYASADTAMKVATKIAQETGRHVIVRDDEMNVIGRVSSQAVH